MIECWQITSSLRWNGAVLEQAWLSLTTGATEWKPVPQYQTPVKDWGCSRCNWNAERATCQDAKCPWKDDSV